MIVVSCCRGHEFRYKLVRVPKRMQKVCRVCGAPLFDVRAVEGSFMVSATGLSGVRLSSDAGSIPADRFSVKGRNHLQFASTSFGLSLHGVYTTEVS